MQRGVEHQTVFPSALIHPALPLLLRLQFIGRVGRACRGLLARRKWLVSAVGVTLAFLWLANAAASVIFREPYPQDVFRGMLSLAMVGYFLWHVLRIAAKRPEHPIDWTPAERHFLLAGPFSRRDLLCYRIAVVLAVTAVKALCVSLLFLPELRLWWAGLLGAFLGLFFVEVLRLLLEFTACGLSRSAYMKARGVVVLLAGFAGLTVIARTTTASESIEEPVALWGLLRSLGSELAGLRETSVGIALESPFTVFARITSARDVSLELAGWIAAGLALLLAAGWLLFRIDALFHARGHETDEGVGPSDAKRRESPARSAISRVPRIAGIGPLAWRQFVGARQHLFGIGLALAAPTVLACLPLLLPLDAATTFTNVVGALAFYSFILLPSALKFDFRRDFERLHVLKSLPLPAPAVVIGQLAVPVIVTSAFQAVVLAIAYAVRPVPARYVVLAALCLLPANLAIYALENVLYLFSPHRLQQEGLEVFFKCILTFTAKGALFAVALVIVYGWVHLSVLAAEVVSAYGYACDRRFVFVIGLAGIAWLAAVALFAVLAQIYARFDASLASAD